MHHRFPPPFAQLVRGQPAVDRFPCESLVQYVCRQRAFGSGSWHDSGLQLLTALDLTAIRHEGCDVTLMGPSEPSLPDSSAKFTMGPRYQSERTHPSARPEVTRQGERFPQLLLDRLMSSMMGQIRSRITLLNRG